MGVINSVISTGTKLLTFCSENSQTILSVIELTSAGLAVFSAVEETIDITRAIDAENDYREARGMDPMSGGEIARIAVPHYIPTTVFLGITVGSCCLKNKITNEKLAGLAALYSLERSNNLEYRKKVKEQLGERKEQKIREAINADRAAAVDTRTTVIYNTGNGNQLVSIKYSTTGPFHSSKPKIEAAINRFNASMIGGIYTRTYQELLTEFDIPPDMIPDLAYGCGWNSEHLVEPIFDAKLTADGVPMLIVDFLDPPKPEYLKVY